MEKRTKVVEEYKSVQEKSAPITEILESSELPEQISNSRDYRQLVDYLVKNHDVRPITICCTERSNKNDTPLVVAMTARKKL
jgi:hypothetical protein